MNKNYVAEICVDYAPMYNKILVDDDIPEDSERINISEDGKMSVPYIRSFYTSWKNEDPNQYSESPLNVPLYYVASRIRILKHEMENLIPLYGSYENVVANAKRRAAYAVIRGIEASVFNIAITAGDPISGGDLSDTDCLYKAIIDHHKHGRPVGSIVVPSEGILLLDKWSSHRDLVRAHDNGKINLTDPLIGHFKDIPIYISPVAPKDKILVCAEPQYVGFAPRVGRVQSKQVEYIEKDKTKKQKPWEITSRKNPEVCEEFVTYLLNGIAVINPRGIQVIS